MIIFWKSKAAQDWFDMLAYCLLILTHMTTTIQGKWTPGSSAGVFFKNWVCQNGQKKLVNTNLSNFWQSCTGLLMPSLSATVRYFKIILFGSKSVFCIANKIISRGAHHKKVLILKLKPSWLNRLKLVWSGFEEKEHGFVFLSSTDQPLTEWHMDMKVANNLKILIFYVSFWTSFASSA